MKYFLALILICLSITTYSREFITDLNGFRLGQYREVPKNELGAIIEQDKFDDGFEYEIFLVEPDTSVYMIFEYPNYDRDIIWSIQITGYKEGYDCKFKDLKLGLATDEIEEILGIPSAIDDMGEYGVKWSYDSVNYNLEISPDGTLAGIKLMDLSHEFYEESDLSKLISYNEYSRILKSSDRKEVANLLSPALEIYKDDSVYYFKNALINEIENDDSGIFSNDKRNE